MEPQFATQIRYNNFSPKLKEHLREWEAKKGIKDDEQLTFEWLGQGDTKLTAYKSTREADEMMDATRSRAMGKECMVNGEDIVDPGTEEVIHLLYYRGIYSANRRKEVIMFQGDDTLKLTFKKKDNLDLYRYLVFSNYMQDNANPARVNPPGGPLYKLLRPEEMVESDWEVAMAKNEAVRAIALATRATLLAIAPKCEGVAHAEGISDNRLRENFRKYAERGTNYLTLTNLLDSDETKFTLNVDKAIEAGVVQVNEENAVWVFSATQAAICPASNSQSKAKQLVDFLLKESGQTTYKQILALTAKARK